MEEKNMGCRDVQEEIIDTAVSLKYMRDFDNPNRDSISGEMENDTIMLSAVAPSTHLAGSSGSSHTVSMAVSGAPYVDVDPVVHATGLHLTSMGVSDATCADISQATQPDSLVEHGHDGDKVPSWAELLPDVLSKVFNLLSLEDILQTIPCVCRTWRLVSQGVPCWLNVNLSEWSCCKPPKIIDKMLLLIANRSQSCLQELVAPNIHNDNILRLIANSGSSLQVLRIPDNFVSEECLCELAPKFTSLTYLDISGHFQSRALIKSFGENCPSITRLNMNMRFSFRFDQSCDTVAVSVAQYMPQLKHLEMAYGELSNVGLKALLKSCTSLEYLDIRGCWHVNMEDDTVLDARNRIKEFLPPVVEDDMYDILCEDDIDDDYDEEYSLDYEDYYFEDVLDSYDFMDENFEYREDFIDDELYG